MAEKKYFRNRVPVRDIDPESLWKMLGPWMQLIDDDQDIRVDYETCKDDFYPVETPRHCEGGTTEAIH